MIKRFENMNKGLFIYFCILALTALGLGLSNDVISNYFKDAYEATSFQRGIIEFPRETPGVIAIFVIAGLSFLSDIRIAMVAQILSIIGIIALGFLTPNFSVMLIFIFINSLGMHLFMPLQDSIGISLIQDKKVGKKLGRFKGVQTAFTMIGGIIVFIGFRFGFFSFKTPIKLTFILSGICFVIVFILFLVLDHINKDATRSVKKIRFVFRKEYKYYYVLVVMFGFQKQMMLVYGPWVLIELLNKKTDTLAILGIIGAFLGTFFIPAIGRWLDRFGIKKLLYADALSFIGVYLLYGILCTGFVTGKLATFGFPVLLVFSLFILDKMSMQMGIIRTVYLKTILVKDTDLTPTLTLGLSVDHVISIIGAVLGGIVWSIWGAQYVFFAVALLSFVNLYVAIKAKVD